MAIYHFHQKILGRSGGRSGRGHSSYISGTRSTLAASAYRSGEKLRDDRDSQTYDFTKKGGVAHNEVMLPDGAPDWMAEREKLWNAVEQRERHEKARLAREIEASLPHDLDADQRHKLAEDWIKENIVDRYNTPCDWAIHEPGKGSDDRNHHFHAMFPTREIEDGELGAKVRQMDREQELRDLRKSWADHANRELEKAGLEERIDERTLVAQREEALAKGDQEKAAELDREPQIHVGPRSKHVYEHVRDQGTDEQLSRRVANDDIRRRNAEKLSQSNARASLIGQKQIEQIVRGAKLDDDVIPRQRQRTAEEAARREQERRLVDQRVRERWEQECAGRDKRLRDGDRRLMADKHRQEQDDTSKRQAGLFGRIHAAFSSKERERRISELADQKLRQDRENEDRNQHHRDQGRTVRAKFRAEEREKVRQGNEVARKMAERSAAEDDRRKRERWATQHREELAARQVARQAPRDRSRDRDDDRGFGRELAREPAASPSPQDDKAA